MTCRSSADFESWAKLLIRAGSFCKSYSSSGGYGPKLAEMHAQLKADMEALNDAFSTVDPKDLKRAKKEQAEQAEQTDRSEKQERRRERKNK